MRKWRLLSIVGLTALGLSGSALASDANALLPTNDTLGCAGFIQQGAVNPPVPTNDLQTLQTCINSCDTLYKSLRGTNYCHESLNNLYYASVAQTVTSQLNQQTKQHKAEEEQIRVDKISQIIQQQKQPAMPATDQPENPPENQPVAAPEAVPANPSLDNINW